MCGEWGSEIQSHGELHLPRRQRLLEESVGHTALGVALRLVWKRPPPEDRIHLAEIGAVEQVEGFAEHDERRAAGHPYPLAQAHVDRQLARHGGAVPADAAPGIRRIPPRAIRRERAAVAVAVEIDPGERCKRPPGRGCDNRRHLESEWQARGSGEDEPVALIVSGRTSLATGIEA